MARNLTDPFDGDKKTAKKAAKPGFKLNTIYHGFVPRTTPVEMDFSAPTTSGKDAYGGYNW